MSSDSHEDGERIIDTFQLGCDKSTPCCTNLNALKPNSAKRVCCANNCNSLTSYYHLSSIDLYVKHCKIFFGGIITFAILILILTLATALFIVHILFKEKIIKLCCNRNKKKSDTQRRVAYTQARLNE